MDRLFIDNDMIAHLDGLKDSSGLVVTGATVEATILDSAKTPVSSQTVTWPITLEHKGSGNYEGSIDSDIDISAGLYYLEVTAVIGATNQTWRVPLKAQERE